MRTPKLLVQRQIPARRSSSHQSTLPRYPDKACVGLVTYVYVRKGYGGENEVVCILVGWSSRGEAAAEGPVLSYLFVWVKQAIHSECLPWQALDALANNTPRHYSHSLRIVRQQHPVYGLSAQIPS